MEKYFIDLFVFKHQSFTSSFFFRSPYGNHRKYFWQDLNQIFFVFKSSKGTVEETWAGVDTVLFV